ncbi:MAG: esterase [Acidobacteria bacterium]|nr:esterase [Acidobacteriota bacterium]
MRFAVFVFAFCTAYAQPPGGRVPPLVSPEVAPDGSVTFRLRAPNAKEVYVTGVNANAPEGRLDMQKNEQGIWTATTGPMKPGIYQYTFNVDGMRTTDPGNNRFQTGFNSARSSRLHVPGGLWTPLPGIARGAITRHFYHSAVAGDDRDFWVYTPAGYDPKRNEPYPVFFLLHGLGDEANSWIENGAANVILDNLIAQGRAKPMIMVNTLGYGYANGPQGAMREGMLNAYAKTAIEEVLPLVEKSYHASKDRTQRAIAGLSMGGAEAVYTGLNHLDKFAWIGSFSGAYVMWPRERTAPAPDAAPGARRMPQITPEAVAKVFPKLEAKANTQIKLLWITCGTADSLVGANRTFRDWLNTKGVKHTYIEVADIGHVWPFWRQNLADFAPLLFR